MPGRQVLSILYYCLLLALLLPVWVFPWFPSTDGPSHLFNAWIFANYDHVPVFQQAYLRHIPTAGNLAGHGLAILLLKAGFPWEVCEKLLASAAILGLALAFRYAVTAFSSIPDLASFLVFPFLYNWPIQMGFWSFNLGVPFLLVSVGLYFRHRGRWKLGSFLCFLLAAGAAYLCHPIAWAVCAFSVAVLVVGTELRGALSAPDRSRRLLQLVLPIAAFLPFAIPNFLFAEKNNHIEWQHISSLRAWLWPLYTDGPVHLFNGDDRAARLLFLVLVLGSFGNFAWKIRRRQFALPDILVAAFVLLLGLGLISPGRIGEGTYIEVRLLLFGFLLWALWLAVTLPRRALVAAAALALIFTGWLFAARLSAWRTANRVLEAFVQLGRVVPPNAFVCQLDFLPQGETVRPLEHLVDLLPAHNFVDVRDYESGRFAFWTRFRPGYFLDEDYMHIASERNFEAALHRFEQRTGKHVDYLVLTDLSAPPEAVLKKELPTRANEYQLVKQDAPWLAIFQRNSLSGSTSAGASRTVQWVFYETGPNKPELSRPQNSDGI